MLDDPDNTVATVTPPKAEEAAPVAPEGAVVAPEAAPEPELIRKPKAGDEEGEAQES